MHLTQSFQFLIYPRWLWTILAFIWRHYLCDERLAAQVAQITLSSARPRLMVFVCVDGECHSIHPLKPWLTTRIQGVLHVKHGWQGHVSSIKESCVTYELIATYHGSWHTYECVMTHVRMSHVTNKANEKHANGRGGSRKTDMCIHSMHMCIPRRTPPGIPAYRCIWEPRVSSIPPHTDLGVYRVIPGHRNHRNEPASVF